MTTELFEAIKDVRIGGFTVQTKGDILKLKRTEQFYEFVDHPLGKGGFSHDELKEYCVPYVNEEKVTTETQEHTTVTILTTLGEHLEVSFKGSVDMLNVIQDKEEVTEKSVVEPVLYASLRPDPAQYVGYDDDYDDYEDEDDYEEGNDYGDLEDEYYEY